MTRQLRPREKDAVQLAVRQHLQCRGWRVHRLTSDLRPGVGAHAADREAPGTPDLLALRNDTGPMGVDGAPVWAHARAVYIECKLTGGKLRPSQRIMHAHLRAQGYRVLVVEGGDAREAIASLEAQL